MLKITKICSKCHIPQTLDCFYKMPKTTDRYRASCKKCTKDVSTQSYTENRDRILNRQKSYYAKNKQVINSKHKQDRNKNKDKLAIKQKTYYVANKDKILNQTRAYRLANRNFIVIYQKTYNEINKAEIAKRSKQYRDNNKDKITARIKRYNQTPMGKAVTRNYVHKRRVLIKQGDVTTEGLFQLTATTTNCFWCDIPLDNTKTHIDHFYPLSKGGKHTLSNLVVSCSKCNLLKRAKDPFEFAKSIGKIL